MKFLKPTKGTWIAFAVILTVNVIFFILGILDIFDEWPLYQIPFFQIGWFYALFRWILNINVIDKSQSQEFIAMPNSFGFVLIFSGSLISLFIHYLIALIISKCCGQKEKVKTMNSMGN